MKITIDNYKDIQYFQGSNNQIHDNYNLMYGLLIDLQELNQLLEDKGEPYRKVYIDYEDIHTEYSPERTEPCPDYYGMFSLRFEKNPYVMIGDYMTIHELDNTLYILINFTEFKLS